MASTKAGGKNGTPEKSGSTTGEVVGNELDTSVSEPPEPPAFDQSYNVLLLGDSGVGKTDLISRLQQDYPPGNLSPSPPSASPDLSTTKHSSKFFATIGINMEAQLLDVGDKRIKLQIWDPSGSDRFRSMITKYFQTAHGVMLVYDINYSKSFQSILTWLDLLETQENFGQLAKILVGNKSDIGKRAVSPEEAEALANEHNMRFLETSTVTGENVHSSFLQLCQEMMKLSPASTSSSNGSPP